MQHPQLCGTTTPQCTKVGTLSCWDLGPLVAPPTQPCTMLSIFPTPSHQQQLSAAATSQADAVVAIACSASVLAVAWQSGRIDVLQAPACTPVGVQPSLTTSSSPIAMHFNCNGSMLAVLDDRDTMQLLIVDVAAKSVLNGVTSISNVWSMVWHRQDPRCLAAMGQAGMRVWQDGTLGEPVDGAPPTAQLACFEGLSVLVGGCPLFLSCTWQIPCKSRQLMPTRQPLRESINGSWLICHPWQPSKPCYARLHHGTCFLSHPQRPRKHWLRHNALWQTVMVMRQHRLHWLHVSSYLFASLLFSHQGTLCYGVRWHVQHCWPWTSTQPSGPSYTVEMCRCAWFTEVGACFTVGMRRATPGLQVVRMLRRHGQARQIMDVAALLGEWRGAAKRLVSPWMPSTL